MTLTQGVECGRGLKVAMLSDKMVLKMAIDGEFAGVVCSYIHNGTCGRDGKRCDLVLESQPLSEDELSSLVAFRVS